MNAQVLAFVNQKESVTKSTSCINLAASLAQSGKKVLAVDLDPQASLSISLGHPQPDNLPVSLSDMMGFGRGVRPLFLAFHCDLSIHRIMSDRSRTADFSCFSALRYRSGVRNTLATE